MQVVSNLNNYNAEGKTLLTIGTFDGVHVGHQKIIKRMVEDAQQRKLSSVVLTFFPHPRMALEKESSIKLIDTLEEKEYLLHRLGVDALIIHPFSKEFSNYTATEFIKNALIKKLNVAKFIIGYDHRFGKDRAVSVKDLIQLGEAYNFEVEIIPVQEVESVAVSSTKIRNAIETGDFLKAYKFLGRPFALCGTVVSGEKLGRTIDFPTANIHIAEDYKLLPPYGAYLVKSKVQNQIYFGMMNVGIRPTVKGEKLAIEVHFFELNYNLYGEILYICVLERIRDEKKFESVNALKKQLLKDQKNCLKRIQQIE